MTKAIRVHQPGGPEALSWDDVEPGDPGEGEALVRHAAVGLNYIDVYMRTGLYPLPSLPHAIGLEAAGTVEAVGPGVTEVAVGDRVAYAGGPPGAYAQARCIPAHRLVAIPDGIDDNRAAAMMLKGMTARYLLRRTHRVKAGETVLVHAAAGGVGLILCQWASHLGATVIGTVGTDEKAVLAQAHGCHHPIVYSREDFAQRVGEITGGAGVDVAYDSVGQATYQGTLASLKPLGMFVSFGNASGPVASVNPLELSAQGSIFFTRPTLMTYTATRADLLETANDLFDVVLGGQVRIEINQTYPLADTAQAHRDLEARKTTGCTLLMP